MRHTGIAFGGGAARGMAHIGALRTIRRRPEYLPGVVAGTSAGSIAASFYAAGLDQPRMEEIAHEFSWLRQVVSLQDTMKKALHSHKGGLISNVQLGYEIDEIIGGKTFSDLDIDLAVVAMDIEHLQRVIFTSQQTAKRLNYDELYKFLPEPTSRMPGIRTKIISDCERVGLAVQASCAVPGVFIPVEYRDMRLVDGGIIDQVPVDVIKAMGAELSIGISLSLSYMPKKLDTTPNVLSGMVGVLGIQQLRKNLDNADIGFQVNKIDEFSLVNPNHTDLLNMGEASMEEYLDVWEREGPIDRKPMTA